ncbi:hypothetical protein Q4506_00615 [Colwellia sp. 4_MG-2023]|uniref:hypothetical protein n=1 Tax=unclassified Colwellia TaxID=196834 RepID=UPI0026E17389|nr:MULTISPECIES: hypothetical protein [unclassified Colwellia]MDO6505547.1 hypothetical protein [Colwellia sp. 5_MG-2023]MDO6554157.1 hypothetical protein [Colwellia sp. 4_MG-2023]
MKKLPLPTVRDEGFIDVLSENQALLGTSYPHLKREITAVKRGYQDYLNNQGNAWNIAPLKLSNNLEVALIKHYNSPPVSITYLDKLRDSSADVCPMCGGFHPTTLDHILPKDDYPAWSLYSKNLVPACGCNMKRGNALKGNTQGVRVLHPYFDTILNDRHLTCVITHANDFRWIRAKVSYVNLLHPDIASIRYHTQNIILKIGIEKWLRAEVNKLFEKPRTVIKTLPKRQPISRNEIIDFITDCLDDYDNEFGTPNNWHSIFIHGLLNAPHIHQWVVNKHNSKLTP